MVPPGTRPPACVHLGLSGAGTDACNATPEMAFWKQFSAADLGCGGDGRRATPSIRGGRAAEWRGPHESSEGRVQEIGGPTLALGKPTPILSEFYILLKQWHTNTSVIV